MATVRKQTEVVTAAQSNLSDNSKKLVTVEKKIADYKFKMKTTK